MESLNILDLVQKYAHELTALRRHFHENPELSGQEKETLAFIEEKLQSCHIPYHHVNNGGIVGWIDGEGGGEGKTLLLRADIDALPIDESPENLGHKRTCRSCHPGVMHACGHDGHMAMLLVEGKILESLKKTWSGKIILMFEQGEEGTGNIKQLLEFLERDSGWSIDACYATHVRWDIPAGKIAICHGPAMAGGFGFKIKLIGNGGHGSRPDLANSPIDCFAAFYQNIQALRMRSVSPKECLTLSIGSIHAGELLNVIPDDLVFAGTSRFFSYDNAGKAFYEGFMKILENECDNYNCRYEILRMHHPLYEAHNDETCTTLAERAVQTHMGEDVLFEAEPWMASETMALTLRLYPGVLTFTGIANEELGCGANHHTPQFDLDERGLIYGAAAGISYALQFLAEQPDIPFTRNIISLADLTSRDI